MENKFGGSSGRYLLLFVVAAITLLFQVQVLGVSVAEYMAEEGVSTTTGDTSGSGNNADFMGEPVWVIGHTAASSYALEFDGDDYLTAEDSASLGTITDAFSMTAWIRADVDSTHDTLVWKVGAFHVWKQNSNLMVTLEGVPNVTDYQIVSGAIANNTWLHVAVTYDGRYLAGYVGGVRVRRIRVNDGYVPISTSDQPLQIGWHSSSPFYRGMLDNVRLYNHKLSDSEVITDMDDSGLPDPQPLVVVQSGIATTAIVIPDSAAQGVQDAADELSDCVQKATGATLVVYAESSAPTGYDGLIYVGPCQATKAAGIEGDYLATNAYVIRSFGDNLFLAGNDADSLDGSGSAFAVYEFVGQQLNARWLWPGESGRYVPQCSDIIVEGLSEVVVPQLLHSRLRAAGFLTGYDGWAETSARNNFINSQSHWLFSHQIARGISMEYGHAFEDYWDLYGSTHPEYFALLPDGTRRPDPVTGSHATLISMCVSNQDLHTQIIDNWEAEPPGNTPWIKGAENDTNGRCTDPYSLAWDVEPADFESEYGCPWSQRLTYATNAYNSSDTRWFDFLGPMSDRYAKFWLALQQEAESRGHSDATVLGYAYANYRFPPVAMQNQLNDRIILAIVPGFRFPWTDELRQDAREQWDGWHDTGAGLYLRPNYILDGHNFPIFYADKLGEDFYRSYHRGMMGTDFDSLNGQYATQGPTLYMLARIHRMAGKGHPADFDFEVPVDLQDLSILVERWLNSCDYPQWCDGIDLDKNGQVDLGDFGVFAEQWQGDVVQNILDEFYGAFGPAEAAIRDYFGYLQDLSDNTTFSAWYAAWYLDADEMFTPAVMSQLRAKMTVAVGAAVGNADAVAKVDFLEKGLTNVEKTLAAQAAWDTYGNGSWQFNAAVNDLDNYRASVEDDGICNMAFLFYWENRNWNRP